MDTSVQHSMVGFPSIQRSSQSRIGLFLAMTILHLVVQLTVLPQPSSVTLQFVSRRHPYNTSKTQLFKLQVELQNDIIVACLRYSIKVINAPFKRDQSIRDSPGDFSICSRRLNLCPKSRHQSLPTQIRHIICPLRCRFKRGFGAHHLSTHSQKATSSILVNTTR